MGKTLRGEKNGPILFLRIEKGWGTPATKAVTDRSILAAATAVAQRRIGKKDWQSLAHPL
jgi:hypothetical protein